VKLIGAGFNQEVPSAPLLLLLETWLNTYICYLLFYIGTASWTIWGNKASWLTLSTPCWVSGSTSSETRFLWKSISLVSKNKSRSRCRSPELSTQLTVPRCKSFN
jgi:hypothetical protein